MRTTPKLSITLPNDMTVTLLSRLIRDGEVVRMPRRFRTNFPVRLHLDLKVS